MFSFLKKWKMMSLKGELREESHEVFGQVFDDYNEHFYHKLKERKKVLKKRQKMLHKIDRFLCLEEYNLICQEIRKYNRAKLAA